MSSVEEDPTWVTTMVVVTFVQAGAVIKTLEAAENVSVVFVVEMPTLEERERTRRPDFDTPKLRSQGSFQHSKRSLYW
jgi:hypothetical protein